MVNKFLNFPEESWWSSNINKVVICNNIPVEIAKKLLDHSLKKLLSTKYSPKKAPEGLEIANNSKKIIFLLKLELILFKKMISTAAIGNLCIKIAVR